MQERRIDLEYRVLFETHHHAVTLTSLLVGMPFERPSSPVVARTGCSPPDSPAATSLCIHSNLSHDLELTP
jgi:hypothetical protein